jgi:hypothetical protein
MANAMTAIAIACVQDADFVSVLVASFNRIFCQAPERWPGS